ncbi:hypothetical protein T11_4970 [Trichinella zimbabwensis]|uniref:Uncharacterized protein n=1 Tax=Trichinella zimbabwensis TaxID=268475 RepID=A0A0V1GAS2_9BILA|nr:hypothetical protein T11_4970 [Trichinella zimbabwensis]
MKTIESEDCSMSHFEQVQGTTGVFFFRYSYTH